MGGFYAVSFSTHLIVFADRQRCRAIEQMPLLFPFLRNTPTSFLNFFASNFNSALELGIYLKTQGK